MLCNEIMDLDPLIRFAAILNDNAEIVAGGEREKISNSLSPEEVKMSLYYAKSRREIRGHLSHRIGEEIYSLTAYEKVKQIAIPLKGKDLLLISAETSANPIQIIDQVFELIKKQP